MSVFFTSDTHFGHQHVAEIRGFKSAIEHDDAICTYWRENVHEDDHLWIVGDLQMSAVNYALDLVDKMPGHKHLVAGNHDPCHPMHRYAYRWQPRYLEVFDSVQAFARRRINGQQVLLSHFPYHNDHTPVIRYSQYRLRDEGRWLMHGHTHNQERLHGHELHVGLDAWDMRFVKQHEVEQLIKGNPPHE